jgi:hypothetical protein
MWTSLVFLFIFVTTSCQYSGNRLQENLTGNEGRFDQPAPTPPPGEPDPSLDGICSPLDLRDIQWPSQIKRSEWSSYALALNISGSFEGREGWKNISGNFDGQGLSLGLMQQNLGQGTLQPLIIEMYNSDAVDMRSFFSDQDNQSLRTMLEAWRNTPLPRPLLISGMIQQGELLFPQNGSLNPLEIGYEEPLRQQAGEANSQSVEWAQNTILDSQGRLIPRWKDGFQKMAISGPYRSQQLSASTQFYLRAKDYLNFFKMQEVRFLLFFFDIVVQNGSIREEHLRLYNSWLAQNPRASDQERAFAILEARLTTVRPQYVADVRARKTAILNGRGVVHQTQRNFPQEYCFDPGSTLQLLGLF